MSVGEPPRPDDHLRRRKRTEGYLALWNVPAAIPVEVFPVPMSQSFDIAHPATIRGRAMACVLIALRGQGLSQLETFAFADAYDVWPHLTVEEHDFVLTEEPSGDALLQHAWAYERAWVLMWAIHQVQHLAFADTPVDTSQVVETLISKVATVDASQFGYRLPKELYDAADIAWCAEIVAANAATSMNPSVVHERAQAFREVLTPLHESTV
jgi:hypothetical protein